MRYGDKKYEAGQYSGRGYKTDYTYDSYLNYSDLNRIYSNYNRCIGLMESCGYIPLPTLTGNWTGRALPTVTTIGLLVMRINNLQQAILEEQTATFARRLTADHVNSWEVSLFGIEDYLINTAQQWRYSGMVVSGGGEFYER